MAIEKGTWKWAVEMGNGRQEGKQMREMYSEIYLCKCHNVIISRFLSCKFNTEKILCSKGKW